MIKVKNVTAHAIVIGTTLFVIPPMAAAEADGNDAGVRDMLAQGKLVAEAVPVPSEVSGASVSDPSKRPEDMTKEELKRLLDGHGVSYASDARKQDLLDAWNKRDDGGFGSD